MPTETPRNSHPHRPDLREHTSFVLTFLPDDSGRTTPDELATLLRQRSVVAAVADGDDLGTPGAAVAIIAVDDSGRVLLDAEGRTVPGQPVEHLVPGLAHLTGRHVVVDDELVVAPDGSESEPDETSLAASTATTLVAWRASSMSDGLVRGIARGAGTALEHATVDGWTLVALPPGITVDAEAFARALASRAERPVVTLQRAGESRAVTWHHRERRRPVAVELAAPPATTLVVPEGAPGSSAARLAEVLGDGTLRVVPDTRLLDAATLAALRDLALERDTVLHDAAALLGLPAEVAELVERAGEAARTTFAGETEAGSSHATRPLPTPGPDRVTSDDGTPEPHLRWLDLPSAVVLEPDPTTGAALVRSLRSAVLDEPVGHGLAARYRRWFWHRPGALVVVALLTIAAGALLGAWAARDGALFGQGWALWVVAGVVVVDGASDLAAGIGLLHRRRRPRR